MANKIFPNEGLDYLLGVIPKAGTTPANLYLFLFTSQTASTVITATQTLAANITEPTYTGYARVAVASTDWGSAGNSTIWGTASRAVTASQKSFPANSGTLYSTAINGFGLASALTGGVCVYQSSFDDQTAIASLTLGDICKVTAQFGFAG